MYKANDVAEHIIEFCNDNDIFINNLRLNVLLYYVQGNSISLQGKPMFNEDFNLWKLAPFVLPVYYRFCVFAGARISSRFKDATLDDKSKRIIDSTIVFLRDFETLFLCRMIKDEDPYKWTYQVYGYDATMPANVIEQCYKKLPKGIFTNNFKTTYSNLFKSLVSER